ncbi:GerAB/ArcD/ProY family transporter [Clostridium sp. HCP1S3_B4]|uniref:GerAB/ArcD/ProY family transporter n=1 Tax=unclassified Clostridium TaxID=2614128 RepID=UPI003F886660
MNKLSTKHFMFFIFCTMVVSIRIYSSVFISEGQRNTWIISLFSGILVILCYLYILEISSKTNTLSINSVYNKSYPKLLNKLLLFTFILGLFVTSVESISSYASSTHTNLFMETPIWFCILFMLIPSCYILTRKFNSILIIVLIIGIIAIIGDIIYLALIVKYLDFTKLLPIAYNIFNKNSLKCFFLILGSMSSVMITLPILNYLSDTKHLIKHSFISTLLCIILIDISLITLITFFGPQRSANIFYPEYLQSQQIQIVNFIEFGQIFYIFRSVCMFFAKYLISSFGIITILKDKIKSKTLFVLLYNIIIFCISIYLAKDQYLFFRNLEFIQYIFIGTFLIIPLITYSIFYIKNKQ